MLAARLTAQLLAGPPAASPVAVAERLLAVQAQDPRGARLAVRARTEGGTAADVDRALTEDRSLLVTTLNRGTLHLVRAEDYPWLQALLAPPVVTANARRLQQEGVSEGDAERALACIERTLADRGPTPRGPLRDALEAAGVPVAGQAFAHLVMLASLRGLIVRGPMVGGDHAFVLVHDWLGAPPPVERDVALAELARRYLAGHGPATEADLAKWAGLPLGQVRAGLAAIADELATEGDHVWLANAPAPATLPGPRLLGTFEPALMGWASRTWILGDHTAFVTVNGIFRPIVLVRGRAVGTWGLAGGTVALDLFEDVAQRAQGALRKEAAAVERYLAAPV